jgi:hypothetical protein
MGKSNKDVLTISEKDEKLIITKIVRDWAKENKINQFEMALRMIGLFYRIVGVQYSFIKDVKIEEQFKEYYLKLNANYDKMFDILTDFSSFIDKKFIPRFGV